MRRIGRGWEDPRRRRKRGEEEEEEEEKEEIGQKRFGLFMV